AGEPGRPADQHRAAYRLGTGAGGQLRCGGGRDRAVPAGEPSAGGPAAAASRQRRRGDGADRVQPAHRLYPYPGVPGRLESRFEPATDLARARDAGGRNRVAAAPRAGPVRARTARTDPYRTRPRTVAAPRGFTAATMTTQARSAGVLGGPTWRDLPRRHGTRGADMTGGGRRRKQTHTPHPVDDFRFTYSPTRPAQLARWHPGVGVALQDAREFADKRWYVRRGEEVALDTTAFLADRREGVQWAQQLLRGTLGRPGRFNCFGLHEWAMVYRAQVVRHSQVPLRLGQEGTDEVVRSHP